MPIGISDKSYVSAINLLDSREINPNVLDITNDEGLTDIAGIAGRYKPTSMAVYNNFVADPIMSLVEVNALPTGNGSVATPLVFVTTAATRSIVRKTDLLKLPDGKVVAVVDVTRAAGGDTVSVVHVNRSVALTPATYTTGTKISVFSVAVGARSKALENRVYGITPYKNVIQIFREVNEEEDIQTMSAIEVKFKGQNKYHVKNFADKYILHKAAVNAALIGGSMSVKADGTLSEFNSGTAGLTDPVGGGSFQTTRGLDEYVELYGVKTTTDVTDVVDLDDFEDMIGSLLAAKAPKSYTGHAGTKVQIKLDNTFAGVNNLISLGRLSLDGQDREFAVRKLKYGGFDFQFANLSILDNAELFGTTAISKCMYFVPTDKVKTKGGGSEPRLQIRYMKHNISAASNKGNDIWAEFHTGGLCPFGATGDELVWRTNWVTYQGLECLGVQHFARLRVLA